MANVLEWERRKWWAWLYIWVYIVLAMVLLGIAMTAANYKYTREIGNPPGLVTSTQWSYDFFVTFFLIFLFFVPASLAYAMDRPQDDWRYGLHMIGTGALVLWNVVTWIYGVVRWAHANNPDPGNFFNPYNDPLNYCPLYYRLSGIPCAYPLMNYSPIPSTANLAPSWMASMQLWVTLGFVVLMLCDVVVTACWVRPLMQEFVDEAAAAEAAAAEEPLIGSRVAVAAPQRADAFRGRRRQN